MLQLKQGIIFDEIAMHQRNLDEKTKGGRVKIDSIDYVRAMKDRIEELEAELKKLKKLEESFYL